MTNTDKGRLELGTKDKKEQTVVTGTEARQGQKTGVIRVLILGLVLAVIAGAAFVLLFSN